MFVVLRHVVVAGDYLLEPRVLKGSHANRGSAFNSLTINANKLAITKRSKEYYQAEIDSTKTVTVMSLKEDYEVTYRYSIHKVR